METELRLAFLGGVQISVAGVVISGFVSSKAPALLCYLAVTGRPHSRSALAGLLWSDLPENDARRNLRVVLANLRQTLAPYLLSTRETIAFDRTQPYWLDVAQLEAALQLHTAATIEQLHAAAALYTGDFLDGFFVRDAPLFDEWATAQRERLRQLVLHALHKLATHASAQGHYADGIDACTRMLAIDPLSEDTHRQFMRLLVLSGQRTAALAQYQTCCQMLNDEFGAEPDPETTTLYEQIRAGMLAPPAATEPPRSQVPVPLTPLLGRTHELAQLSQLLAQPHCRLLTLVGLGGMGKTRLALELARTQQLAFADGVLVVSLAPLTDAATIAPTIATALGITATRDPQQALLRALSDKQLLLVLDNFEHVMEGVALVVEILQAAPRVVLVATSRERLHVRGEYVYPLHGLAYTPDLVTPVAQMPAVALFVQSAQRVQPNLTMNSDQLDAVVRICALVQGMPLALELAAAWAETLPLHVIASEIASSADFLTSEWRDIPERQRSMRAVFEWSWHLLHEAERQVLRKLAVFRGGFTREAAATITGASLAQLTRLVQKSLIRWVVLDETPGRYEIHELLRQFAAEQLVRTPEEHAAVSMQHSAFYLQAVVQQEPHLARNQQQQGLAAIRSEIDNVRQAWIWAVSQKQIALVDASAYGLWLFFLLSGFYAEVIHTFGSAADHLHIDLPQLESTHASEAHQRVASKLLALCGFILVNSGQFDQALATAQQARTLGAARMDTETEMLISLVQGRALTYPGPLSASRASLEQALQLAQPHYMSSTIACFVAWNALVFLGWIDQQQNDYARARQQYEYGLHICHQSQSLRGNAILLGALAGIDIREGDYQAAREHYEQSWQLARTIQYRWVEGLAQLDLGGVMRMIGQYGRALELIEQALTILRDVGDDFRHSHAIAALGRLYTLMGDYQQAQRWLDAYLDLAQSIKTRDAVSDGLTSLALLAYHTEAYQQALAYADQAQQIAQETGTRLNQARSLLVIGHVQVGLDHFAEAAAAYQQALTLFGATNNRVIAVEAQAGVAWMALNHGDRVTALLHVEAILDVLADHPHIGLDEPFYTYVVCYRVLRALGDSRAAQVLHTAQQLLQTYAEHIFDPALRHSFLENVALHRELLHPDRAGR